MPGLGTSQMGTEILAGSVTYVGINPTSATTSTEILDSNTEADTSTIPATAKTTTQALNPVTLSPENIHIEYNESQQEFQSKWFEKNTPLDEAGELVVVGTFRNQTFEPVDLIVERDETGDETPDSKSDLKTLDDDNHILRIDETENGEEIAQVGATYRLRFPNYDQTDALDLFTMALGWPNQDQFNEEWDISPVSTESQPAKALVAIMLSENYRFDATLDEIFDSQHIESSNDKSLEYLAKEVGTSRRENENDLHLRKRVLAKSATRTFSSAGQDVTDLIGLIFEDQSGKVGVGVATGEPVLEIEVPTTVMENHILTAAEAEDLIDEAVSSSYNAKVTTI